MPHVQGDDAGIGFGVRGTSTSALGVTGESQNGIGVSGVTEAGTGLVGQSKQGTGVQGQSETGKGVHGESDNDNGVFGQTANGDSAGVFGRNTGAGGNGVVGLAEGLGGVGVFGQAAARGTGVIANGATGLVAIGDAGPGTQSSSIQDHGVIGQAERAGFAGVNGLQSALGPGVRGHSPLAEGVMGEGTIGVLGHGNAAGAAGQSPASAGVIGRQGPSPQGGWLDSKAGVVGQSSEGGRGVVGMSTGAGSVAVDGEAAGFFSTGVSGKAAVGVAGTGPVGVMGTYQPLADSSSGFLPAGVSGASNVEKIPAVLATASYGANGVYALSDRGIALYGNVSGDGTAVVGISPYPKNPGAFGFAGNFWGSVNVTGPVHKSGGGFRIDHPIDPENKYLDHSFVESDEMKNVYDGVVELGSAGRAAVPLPHWFEALNRDCRYQLTAIGHPAPELHVAREISDGSFEIAGGRAGQRVSWQVTGVRRDPWAEANRLSPEVDKVDIERGRYRHPEVYGQESKRSIAFALFGADDPATGRPHRR